MLHEIDNFTPFTENENKLKEFFPITNNLINHWEQYRMQIFCKIERQKVNEIDVGDGS